MKRMLFSLPLMLAAACSSGDEPVAAPEEAEKADAAPQSEEAASSEIEEKAKSIEEAADAAAELVEAESRQEIRSVRPKIEDLENAPQ